MKLICIDEGVWKPGKHGDGQNKRVSFKSVDPEDKKYYYLNLTDYEVDKAAGISIENKWLPFAKKGNILDVDLYNENTIAKFRPFHVIKKVEE
jgi:hypothetical protein